MADPLLREHLQKLVASLPEKKRMLVILRYQEEMEMEEIARMLGGNLTEQSRAHAAELLNAATTRH